MEKIALSNRSNFSSSLLFPQIPPREVARSFTPSMEFTLSFVVSIRMTFLNELPSHNIAARGAKKAKCSCGHSPARNSSFLGYSLISVSPGLKAGIMFQGKCERAVWPVPAELVAKVGTVPAGSSAPLDILDRGSSATSVELVGAPWLYPILLQSKLHQGPPEPQRKAPHLLWLQPRTVVTYWGYASPRCCTWATFSWHVWFIPNWMGTWQTTHCTGHPMPSHASGSRVYKSYIYMYIYICIYICVYIYIAFIFIDVYDLTTMFCPSRVRCFFACSVYFFAGGDWSVPGQGRPGTCRSSQGQGLSDVMRDLH